VDLVFHVHLEKGCLLAVAGVVQLHSLVREEDISDLFVCHSGKHRRKSCAPRLQTALITQ
jgi:hypothetical protein